MCMGMYVCMYICMGVYVCMWMYVHMYVYVGVCVCIFTWERVFVCVCLGCSACNIVHSTATPNKLSSESQDVC